MCDKIRAVVCCAVFIWEQRINGIEVVEPAVKALLVGYNHAFFQISLRFYKMGAFQKVHAE